MTRLFVLKAAVWVGVAVCFGLQPVGVAAQEKPVGAEKEHVVGRKTAGERDNQPAEGEKKHVERARELLRMFLDGRDAEFVGAGDETMLAGFKAEKSAQTRQQFLAQFGNLDGGLNAVLAAAGGEYQAARGFHSVSFKVRYEKAVLGLQVTLNDAGKLSGFHVMGVEAKREWEAPAYVSREAFTEEKVTVGTGEFELPGTLSVPKAEDAVDRGASKAVAGGKRWPAVVLVHGSGPNDEDETLLGNKPFRDLAWGLASKGVAVLRYEKRTHKYGAKMDSATITLEQETIDDAVAGVKLLQGRAEFDAKRVFVLGHSLGGMAAPFIASREPRPAGIVILAGSARPIADVVEDQIRYLSKDAGDSAEAKAETEKILDMIAQVRAGTADAKANLIGAPVSYWNMLARYDPVEEAKKLTCPILIIQGGRDYQVTMKCFARWKEGLAGRTNVTFKLYERLNHLMVAGDGASTPKEYMEAGHVEEGVVGDVVEYIMANG